MPRQSLNEKKKELILIKKSIPYKTECEVRLYEKFFMILSYLFLPNFELSEYEFTTCNNTGRHGPAQKQCDLAYNNTLLNNSVKVITDPTTGLSNGIQVWTVPQTKHYT